MTEEVAIVLTLAIPSIATVLIAANDRNPQRREAVTLVASVLLLLTVITLIPDVLSGQRPSLRLFEIMPGFAIEFQVEPLGLLFACVAAFLWPLNSIYSIGYMRANREANQTRFYMCFAIAIASAMGIAFSANLVTLFVCYEALTLSTYPLVTHKGDLNAKLGGRTYLGILLTTSIGFLLPAIIWTWWVAGTVDFVPGGILDGHIEGVSVAFLLALYMFGIGKAALMPFHRWLPAAMVAPTPVSALLHAVAVVKGGVFTVMKVAVYVFGTDFLSRTGASDWLVWVAAITLLGASTVALTKDNLKARLAYSTISQLAYVVLGAALATSLGVIGGSLQIATHAVGKITLFFCAGAIYTAAHKTEISQMDGLGRVMPVTYGAFFIGALSIIGLPPMGGTWSKWYLMVGAAEADQLVMIGVLMLSSLLSIGYLMPVVARGFFLPRNRYDRDDPSGDPNPRRYRRRINEAPGACLLPICLTALGCLVLFFYADAITTLLRPIAGY